MRNLASVLGALLALVVLGGVAWAAGDQGPSAAEVARQAADWARADMEAQALLPVVILAKAIGLLWIVAVIPGAILVGAAWRAYVGYQFGVADRRLRWAAYQMEAAKLAPLSPGPPVVDAPPSVAPASLELPGVTTLGGIAFRPSAGAILLGLGPGGAPLVVPAGDALCHITFAGPTGVGKTNLMRLILTQLIAAGLEVYLCDPHFTPINPKTGEDWRGIAAGTVPGRAITDRGEIAVLIAALGTELDRRLALWHQGQDPGPARFYAIEELPLLAQEDRDFMQRLGRLLREGRKLGLYVIVAMQDALISTIGGSSGLRSQFQTCYFGGDPGTDPTTARALLGSAKLGPAPGKGIVWLRSAATAAPLLVRVPLVTNSDIAGLLGATSAASGPLPPHFPSTTTVIEAEVVRAGAAPAAGSGPELPPEVAAKIPAVQLLLAAGASNSDIIKQVWGVTGGNAYTRAAAEYTTILAWFAAQVPLKEAA